METIEFLHGRSVIVIGIYRSKLFVSNGIGKTFLTAPGWFIEEI